MRLAVDLKNSALFQPIEVAPPADKVVSELLYQAETRISTYSNNAEKEAFITQWSALIDQFSRILRVEIYRDLYADTEEEFVHYPSLADRLKNGIAESILNSGDGLLPNQPDSVFAQLKMFLESVCVYCLKNPKTVLVKNTLKDLHQKLDVCGPGLFTHIQQVFYEFYHPKEGLFYWLADFREMILMQFVQKFCTERSIELSFVAHVYTLFAGYAKKQGWHLLQEASLLRDSLATTVIPQGQTEKIYTEFRNAFHQEYARETVTQLCERLSYFLRTCFSQYANRHHRLSSKNEGRFEAFFASVIPVLDSFHLPLSIFLIDVSTPDDDCVTYSLNKQALRHIKYYVATGLSHLKMLSSDPLRLLIEMSQEHVAPAFDFIDSVSSDVWFRKFQQAFNANPPEQYQTKTSGSQPQLFRSEPVFDKLLKRLGFAPRQNEAGLSVLLKSEMFRNFLCEQLSLPEIIISHFCKKQGVILEVEQPLAANDDAERANKKRMHPC
jgi:hypothetical protein